MTHASINSITVTRPSHAGRASHRGFSLTELLVVIGIIVLLIGLLLVALRGVMTTARETRSQATNTQFSNACTAFQSLHGRYPGVIPEDVLLDHSINNPTAETLSSTENALLDLMGGFRLLTPADITIPVSAAEKEYTSFTNPSNNFDVHEMTFNTPATGQTYQLAYVVRRLGEGPVINGKPHQASFTPGANELVIVEGQMNQPPPPHGTAGFQKRLPEPVDAWGQPLMYIRQARPRGPLRDDPAQPSVLPQFELAGVSSYLGWPHLSQPANLFLGEMGQDQIYSQHTKKGSILTIGSEATRNQTFAAIVGHPSFYRPPPSGNPLNAAPRGQFFVISAGQDGIFFSYSDGPFVPDDFATPGAEEGVVQMKIINVGPKVISEFDDIVTFGGG